MVSVLDRGSNRGDRWRRWTRAGVLAGLAAGLLATNAFAQQTGRIVGRVQSSSGAPIAEVQVYLQGTEIGVLTRIDGRFTLVNVPAGTHVVRAERIGYGSIQREVTVTAGGEVEANFTLESQALGLDEIVVTGTAGAARRREIGNTISQINVADIPDRPTTVTDIITAAAPGIEVVSAGGETGQGSVIRLRGNTSVSMSNQPIIYIDGVRMMSGAFPQTATPDYRAGRGANITASPLDIINPNDIERIEVIKGSAATTLYGTEASAGVIQVFTKRGAQGAPVWTFETQQGTAWARKFGYGEVPYLNMDPWICTGLFECGEFTHQAYQQMYFGSVRGGGSNLQYFASGQYDDETGLQPNDALEKYTVRGNFTFTPFDELQMQWNTSYSNQWQSNTPTGNNAQGLTLNVFRQERNYFGSGEPDSINEVLKWDIEQRIERFTTGGTFTYSPFSSLTNRFTIGYDFSQQEARNLRPFGFAQFPQGGLSNNTWQKRLITFDYVGTYSFAIAENLRSNFSWGGQAIGDEERSVEAWGEGFPGAAEPTVNSAAFTLGFETREKVWNAGFFLQNVFDIRNRYFLTLGMRVDGNSAFGEGFGLQFYPKASGTWVISDETFWPEQMGAIKLRAAYGKSGRAPGAFDAVRTWNPAGWAGEPAFVPQNVGNPDLGPEVTAEFETGFDGSWFDDRVRSTFTYYRQITSDALFPVGQIPSQGFTGTQLENVGKLKNSGIELTLEGSPIRNERWGWDIGLNLTTNNSEVLDLGGVPEFTAAGGVLIEGHPVPVNRGTIITNPDEIGPPELQDEVILGPELPTLMFGVNTTVRLPGGITLGALGEFRGGNVLNVNPISIDRSVRSPYCFPYYVNPQSSITLKDDTPALWRSRCTPGNSQGYWYDADYFKLRSVSATVPVNFLFPSRVNNATLTLALNNSYLWMKDIPWMDPELLGNDGANEAGLGATERVPSPIRLRAALRISF